jgi:beta-barrel assembly-enhancing protease
MSVFNWAHHLDLKKFYSYCMQKFTRIFLFVVFSTATLCAQTDFNNFKGLKSSGPVPKEFTIDLADRYKAAHLASKDVVKGIDQKMSKAFHLNRQYSIDDLLKSGWITYGDPVTNYLQKVADKVLESFEGSQKSVKVFTSKSAFFNISVTYDGVMFVNLGLLSQVENEAQLAFAMALELVRFEKNLVLKGFIENRLANKKYNATLNAQRREDLVEAFKKSKKMKSIELDRDAFNMFMVNSGYDPIEAVRVLEIMLYSYLPFDEVPFQKDFFNKDYFKLKPSLFPDNVKEIAIIENFQDSLSPFPNLRERRDSLEEQYLALDNKNPGKLFLLDEEEFFMAQKIARFELSNTYLTMRDYPEAIYNSYLLLQKDPNNRFLRESIALSLHTFSTYKNNKQEDVMGKVEAIEGEMQAVYHFLKEVSPLELNVLAAHYSYQLYKDFPNDAFAKRLFSASMKELVFFHDIKSDYFYEDVALDNATTMKEEPEPTPTENAEETRERGRSTKVQTLKKQRQYSEQTDSIRMAFVGELQNPLFANVFEDLLQDHKARKDQKTYVSEMGRRELRKKEKDNKATRASHERRENYLRNNPLPIRKVVVASPDFRLSLPENWDWAKRPDYKSQIGVNAKYLKSIENSIHQTGLEYVVLDSADPKNANSETLNLANFARMWFSEYWDHPNEENMVSWTRQADAFVEATGTPYILYTGARLDMKSKMADAGFFRYVVPALIYFPAIINLSINVHGKKADGMVYTFIINVQTGEMVYSRVDNFDGTYQQSEIEAITYSNIRNLEFVTAK